MATLVDRVRVAAVVGGLGPERPEVCQCAALPRVRVLNEGIAVKRPALVDPEGIKDTRVGSAHDRAAFVEGRRIALTGLWSTKGSDIDQRVCVPRRRVSARGRRGGGETPQQHGQPYQPHTAAESSLPPGNSDVYAEISLRDAWQPETKHDPLLSVDPGVCRLSGEARKTWRRLAPARG